MNERIPIQCGACKQSLFVDAPEPAKIANLDSASVLIVEHPTQYECPHCQSRLALALGLGPLMVFGRPVKKEVKSSIILM